MNRFLQRNENSFDFLISIGIIEAFRGNEKEAREYVGKGIELSCLTRNTCLGTKVAFETQYRKRNQQNNFYRLASPKLKKLGAYAAVTRGR